MSILLEEKFNIFHLENQIWLLTKPTGLSVYDFNFEQFFECRHVYQLPETLTAVARIGASENYAELYEQLSQEGIHLIHSPEQQLKCTELPNWYPLILDLTPKSIWFSEIPSLEQIEAEFTFPIFVKGSRQTSKHQKHLSIVDTPQAFATAMEAYRKDPILHWQKVVVREYINLRPIAGGQADKIPASYEFRTFWWKGHFVGAGQYWFQADSYHWMTKEEQEALSIAREVASRLDVPFLVVDIAQRSDGQWIVIECNDGQESGYAGLAPMQLWKNILAVEQNI